MKSFKQFIKEELLNEQFSQDIEDVRHILLKKFKENDFIKKSANRLKILSDDGSQAARSKDLDNLAKELAPFGWRRVPHGISSVGYIEKKGKGTKSSIILLAPKSKQGSTSAGVENEQILLNTIDEYLQTFDYSDWGEYLTVTFKSGRKKVSFKNIEDTSDVSRNIAEQRKADIVLIDDSGKEIPISIKKDKAEIWESADRYWGKQAGQLLKKLLAMKNPPITVSKKFGDVYQIHPELAVRANKKQAKDVVFGSDILGKGIVVMRSFKPKDFKYDGKKHELTINATEVIANLNDIPEDEYPYFLLRNDQTRTSNPNLERLGFKGLRTLAQYKSRINKNVYIHK